MPLNCALATNGNAKRIIRKDLNKFFMLESKIGGETIADLFLKSGDDKKKQQAKK